VNKDKTCGEDGYPPVFVFKPLDFFQKKRDMCEHIDGPLKNHSKRRKTNKQIMDQKVKI